MKVKMTLRHPFAQLVLIIYVLLSFKGLLGYFVGNTLVKTPSGYTEIQNLNSGDEVICYDFKGKQTKRAIRVIQRSWVSSLVELSIGNQKIYIDPDHYFYSPNAAAWMAGQFIWPGYTLLKQCKQLVPVLNARTLRVEYQPVYNLDVNEYHNFCASTEEITMYNMDTETMIEASFPYEDYKGIEIRGTTHQLELTIEKIILEIQEKSANKKEL